EQLDLNNDGQDDLILATGLTLYVRLQDTLTTAATTQLDISTQEGATALLEVLNDNLSELLESRALLRAQVSRLGFADSVGRATIENLSAAKSQALDTD